MSVLVIIAFINPPTPKIELLVNALKFCESTPCIKLYAKKEEEGHLLYVEDNGIGIPKDKQQSIFQPMIRAHASNKYEGYGLGLAQCSRIVEQHHGKIWVESEVNQGTTVVISFFY